jgi:hypothetical protein
MISFYSSGNILTSVNEMAFSWWRQSLGYRKNIIAWFFLDFSSLQTGSQGGISNSHGDKIIAQSDLRYYFIFREISKKGDASMDKLVIALGPAFAAGFAIQRLLEILDSALDKVEFVKNNKKMTLSVISLIIGFILAFWGGLRVLQPLGFLNSDFLDVIVTALVISAGTEGFNSVMKFLGYAKQEKKLDAAGKMGEAPPGAIEELQQAA